MSALAPGVTLGPHRIEAPIGAGGMGVVWKARDTRLDRTVAIKTIEGHFSERFEREAKTIASLNHPHICTLHDVGENYLVMEYIEGAPLKGPLPLSEVVKLGAQIAEALDAAHRKGITHRDLKPANVLVTKGGVKVIDFGLAKGGSPVRGEQDVTLTKPLTGEGTILGTVPYMSPEQLQGQEADARSDIFALGCVLYEMLTGRRAFEGKSQVSIMAAILEHEPAPLTEPVVPAWLDRLIRRCLRKNPDDRWQNARDIAIEIRESRATEPAPQALRRRSVAIPSALTALGLAAGWIAATRLHPPHSREDPAIRFQLHPPQGGRLDRAGMAVSPDGRHIALVATVQGKRALWVHALDGAGARLLPNTSEASVPFWSPDSRSVAYQASGQLWRIDINSGAPQAICEVSSLRDGAWGADGVILYSETNGGVRQVSAGGGRSTPLTKLDAALEELGHSGVAWLPGGRFLFFARSSKPQNTAVYAASLAKPEERVKLVEGDIRGALYSSGHLLWRRGTILVAQPFDPTSLKLSGEPRPVVDSPIGTNRFGSSTVTASAGGVLSYFARDTHSRFTWFDRTGKELGAVGEPDGYGAHSLSPDGERLAVVREPDLWLVELARGVWSRFTFNQGAAFPIWSPDGRFIAYKSTQLGRLYRKDTAGASEQEQIAASPNQLWATDWSRDGRFLLYYELSPQTRRDLWYLPMPPNPASPPRPYIRTPFNEYIARFSPEPNPRWVVYQSDESGKLEIYVQAFPEPRAKRQISIGGGGTPRWSRDGREIFYLSPEDKLMAVTVNPGVAGLAPSPPRELFTIRWNGELTGPPFEVASDGQRFLIRASDNRPLTAEVIVNWPALLAKQEGGAQ